MKRSPRGETRRAVLTYIRWYQQKNGMPPAVREIGEALGLRSTASVQHHINNLVREGLLLRADDKTRTLRAVPV